MAIRKDLNDMLNNLKGSSETAQKAAKQADSAEIHKKSIYDEMSVDDLLSALTETKDTEQTDDMIGADIRSTETTDETVSIAEEAKPLPPIEDESSDEEDIPVIVTSVMHTEASAEMTKVFSASEIAQMEEKAEKAAKEPVPEPQPEKTAPKKKKIVITGQLPDYEEIRRRELEKDRIAREKAEAAEKEAENLQANEEIAEEAVITSEGSEKNFSVNELTEANEAAVETDEEQDAPSLSAGDGAKKGFFSKIKSILTDSKTEEDDDADHEEESSVEAPDDEAPAEEILSDEAAQELAESFAEAAENASATELLDAAIAAINSEVEAAEQENITEKDTDIPEALSADDPEEASAETEQEPLLQEIADQENSDPVDNMLDNMREETESAIADIEKLSDDEAGSSDESEEISSTQENTVDDVPADNDPKPKKKGKITAALENILDEDPDEIISERSEKAEDDEAVPEKGRFKKTLYTILGVIFSVFAVIGVITVIAKGAGLVKSFTSGEVKKDGFTEIIYPPVIMDIESFNSPSELTSEQVITATLWSIIMDDSKASKYESALGDTVSIPDVDVEKYAVELFGENLPAFEHCTVGPVESRFYYSEGAYNVKLRPIIFTYSPEIKSIVKSGSEYTLTVDYIDELPSWMEKSTAKTVEFGLVEREDGTFRIDSMKIISVKTS